MKIACIGDSIVNGFPFSRKESWPSLLAEATGWEVINRGMNGDHSFNVFRRLEGDALSHDPDTLIIMTGANDFVFIMNDPKGVATNISFMIDAAQAKGVKPVVCTPILTDPKMAPVKWVPGDYRKFNRQILELRDLLKEICEEKNAQFLDLITAYEEFGKYQDGVHPTREGYQFLADLIKDALNNEES